MKCDIHILTKLLFVFILIGMKLFLMYLNRLWEILRVKAKTGTIECK